MPVDTIAVRETPGGIALRQRMSKQIAMAEAALAEVRTLEDALAVEHGAEALRYAIKQANLGLHLQHSAAEVRLRAARRAGDILLEVAHPKRGYRAATDTKPTTIELGIGSQVAWRYKMIAGIDEAAFNQFMADRRRQHQDISINACLRLAKKGRHVRPLSVHTRERRRHGFPAAKHGTTDACYAFLRKALQEGDGALREMSGAEKATMNAAMTSLYEAADRLLELIGKSA